jgi:glycosyltransferase involved in cell wall biosynthesis
MIKASQSNISLVIPACNEEDRIEIVVLNYVSAFPDAEIIVVCNGCVDNTCSVVRRLCTRYPQIKALDFPARIGKGGAIIEGFKVASGDIVGFIDADESTAPGEMAKLLTAMNGKDGVIGSRKLKESVIPVKQPWKRRFASRIFNIIVCVMFDLKFKDTQCGAKVFRKEAIDNILSEIRTRGFEFDVELLWKLKRNGYRLVELPVTWSHSEGSTFSMANAPKMFFSLLKVKLSG